jgi:hypothetical protein
VGRNDSKKDFSLFTYKFCFLNFINVPTNIL